MSLTIHYLAPAGLFLADMLDSVHSKRGTSSPALQFAEKRAHGTISESDRHPRWGACPCAPQTVRYEPIETRRSAQFNFPISAKIREGNEPDRFEPALPDIKSARRSDFIFL